MKPRGRSQLLLCAVLALACAAHARAQEGTEAELLRQIFPDLSEDKAADGGALARTSIPLRHLFGAYPPKVYSGPVSVIPAGRFPLGGGRLLLVVRAWPAEGGDREAFEWGELTVLALYGAGDGGAARLLDAADVQGDRHTALWEKSPVLSIGPGRKAFVVAASHHNSSQGYLSLSLVAAEGGRLRHLFDLPTLLDSNACGDAVNETATLTPLKAATRSGRYDLQVSVRVVKAPDPASCGTRTRGYTRRYRARLVWNPSKQRYEARGQALRRLARFNEQRF